MNTMDNGLKYEAGTVSSEESRKWGAPGLPNQPNPTITKEDRMRALLVHCKTSYEQCQEIRNLQN